MHSMAMRVIPIMDTCPVCGLPFARTCSAQAWGYAYDGKLVCSYHCMRKAERMDLNMSEIKKATDAERKARNAEIIRMHQEKVPVHEIAAKFGISIQSVWAVCRHAKKAELKAAAETAPAEQPAPTAPMNDRAADQSAEIERLKSELDAQRKLAMTAADLMKAWKRKHELTMKLSELEAEMDRLEKEYFQAIFDVNQKGGSASE